MDEIIIRLARAIACLPRLWILAYLAIHGEVIPTVLAAKLRMARSAMSMHLKVLCAVGLIRGRRSGARCHYAFISPYGEQTLSGSMARWLCQVLKEGAQKESHRGVHELRDGSPRASHASLHATIFQAATAFTDLRRLQILRYLETHDEATVENLRNELKMSRDAVFRHTDKLRRRGLLRVQAMADGSFAFSLAREYKTPIHEQMHAIVRGCWKKKASRSS
ncbi:MAG: helix-turn-helix transcriptional regulator [Planctomycetes bacterium]|nr:helix-turn-helix transcriptional regulator [Planctomycetota bacterium]MBM4078250.1 helix-turn-helix transcriptional regulator [Planctomycetota bacterium]MBM4083287.1 helix-turn-helix transcriptional regulator [Planctomycetota bacterium]